MTAPKWGGPWIGAVVPSGHWETPDVVTLTGLEQDPDSVTKNAQETPGVYDSPLGSWVPSSGFLGDGSGVNSLSVQGGAVDLQGLFAGLSGLVGTLVAATVNITGTASVVKDGVGDWGLVSIGTYSPGASPFSGTVSADQTGYIPVGYALDLIGQYAYFFHVQAWSMGSDNGQPPGTVSHNFAISAVTLDITYQPPDVWVWD